MRSLSTGKVSEVDFFSGNQILDRVLIAYGIPQERGWQAALAKKAGVKPNVVSLWKSRGVPERIVSNASIETGANKKWIETGEGEMRQAEYQTTNSLPPDMRALVVEQLRDYKAEKLSEDTILLVQMFQKMTPEQQHLIITQAAAVMISNID